MNEADSCIATFELDYGSRGIERVYVACSGASDPFAFDADTAKYQAAAYSPRRLPVTAMVGEPFAFHRAVDADAGTEEYWTLLLWGETVFTATSGRPRGPILVRGDSPGWIPSAIPDCLPATFPDARAVYPAEGPAFDDALASEVARSAWNTPYGWRWSNGGSEADVARVMRVATTRKDARLTSGYFNAWLVVVPIHFNPGGI